MIILYASMLLSFSSLIQPASTFYDVDMTEFLNANHNEVVMHTKISDQPVPYLKNKRNLAAAPPDPCAQYEDTQKQTCKKCNASYELIIFNTTKTICGKMSVDTDKVEICTINSTEYPAEYAFYTKAKNNSFIKGETRILFRKQSNGSVYTNYCSNQQLYYLRWKSYCHNATNPYKFIVPANNASFCSLTTSTFTNLTDDSTIVGVSMENSMTCFACTSNDMLYSDLRLKFYPQFGIWGGLCVPQYPHNNCSTSPYIPFQRPVCEVTSLYNNVTKRCQYCGESMPRCSYCESFTNCTLCRKNMFWNLNGTYQYLSNVTDVNIQRRQECMYDVCSRNYCQNYQTRSCEKQSSSLTNCLKCMVQTADTTIAGTTVQLCQICENGYIQSSDMKSCIKLPTGNTNFVYYVKPIDKLLLRNSSVILPNEDNSTILECARLVEASDLNVNIDPSNFDKASPMLQLALRRLYLNENTTSNVTATIYIAKGIHYFISCRGDELTQYSINNIYGKYIFKYCEEYDLYRYNYNAHDNWYITIQALECQFGKALGLDANPKFLSSCVDFSKGDPKPTIYVSDVWTGFNITGKLTIKNLKFSGMNMLVKQTMQANMVFNLYPQTYCQSQGEPKRNIDGFQLDTLTTCVNLISNLKHQCSLDFQISVPDKSNIDSYTCELNNQQTFNPVKQSTLRCRGEIYSDDYFFLHPKTNTYSRRRRSLFNLYSFADHKTMKKDMGPPELVIENSDFEYFLADTIESLIYIESMSSTKVVVIETLDVGGVPTSTNVNYYQYDGADRGAKILISNSNFKHSLFCKGLIVYRSSYVDLIGLNPQQINFTNLYMKNPIRNQSGSYILIKNSNFKNLNAFYETNALAITGEKKLTFKPCNTICSTYTTYTHKGIVMNLEDFGGRVEVVGSIFENNAHYISDFLYRGDSQTTLDSINTFRDVSNTKELQFRTCNQINQFSKFLFGESLEFTQGKSPTEIDTLFEQYERLGLIYISRNKDVVVIKDNTFKKNIGTFGGTITINSPDWNQGKQPHVLIKRNSFTQNMAYYGGNAIYIRNMINKHQINSNFVCGGVTIVENYFRNNIGMKVHNGGAITAKCDINQVDAIHVDNASSSGISLNYSFTSSTGFQNDSVITITSMLDQTVNVVQKFKFTLVDNTFEENFSGGKGSAVYISQMSQVRIFRNSFIGNGPVYAQNEFLYSPYFALYSDRAITYYDEECIDEFSFLQDCNNQEKVKSDQEKAELQFSNVRGAVYVAFCESTSCINSKASAELEINECQFIKNLAGPILNKQSSDSISQLYIQGGQQVIILNTEFSNNGGSPYLFQDMAPFAVFPNKRYLINFFPDDYFKHSHSPMIKILSNPPPQTLLDYNYFNFTFQNCDFLNNRNIEVLGLDVTEYTPYKGSIIEAQFGSKTEYFQNVDINLIIQDSLFSDNYFIGSVSSLIYAQNVQVIMQRSKFINNGKLFEKVITRDVDDSEIYVSSSEFPFNTYTHTDTQAHGCLYLEGSLLIMDFNNEIQLPTEHIITNNTFKYIFSSEGSAYYLDATAQNVYLYGNTYSYMFASNEGSILKWVNSYYLESVFMDQEFGLFLFGGVQGAIVATPLLDNQVQLFMFNSTYNHSYAQSGQIIGLFEVNKFLARQCNFLRSPYLSLADIKMKVLSSFKKGQYQLFEMIKPEIVDQMIVGLDQNKGAISLINIYDDSILQNITYKNQIFLRSNDALFRYAQFIDCNFIGLYANKQPVIFSESSQLAIYNTVKGKYFIANNTANEGNDGAISVERESQFVLINVVFLNNTAVAKASALHIDNSIGNLTNIDFKRNQANSSGTVVIESESKVNLTSCLFEQNQALDSSALFIQNNLFTKINLRNSTFVNNTSGQSLINVFFSTVFFENCVMIDNIANEVNHGITLLGSKAFITNLTINYTIDTFINRNTFQVDSGFFMLTSRSDLTLLASRIYNCRGGNAAVLTYMGRSKAKIGNGTIIQNCFANKGPVILSSLSQMLEINNSTFQKNGQSDIMLTETDCKITNSKFIGTQKSSIKIAASFIQIENSYFEDDPLSYFGQLRGSALQLDGISMIKLINNTFNMLKSVQGGAIFIDSTYENYLNVHQQYLIERNQFKNNKAQHGGAIYIQDGKNIIIKDNIFESNQAFVIDPPTTDSVGLSPKKGLGGALYINCDSYTDSNPNACNVTLMGKNVFKNNYAENDGGAFLWSKQKPVIDNFTQFENNTAYYGGNFASYPKQVKIKFLNKKQEANATLRLLQSNSSSLLDQFPSLVSGGGFDFDIDILDQEGNIYKTDSSSKARVTIKNATVDQSVRNNEVVASQGTYKFRNLMIISKPGTSPKLAITFIGVETFGNDIDFAKNDLNIPILVRNCTMGEELTVDNRCVPCEKYTYLLEAPKKPTTCKDCPANAYCYGLNLITPVAGYWRSSNLSVNFIACPNPPACQKGNTTLPIGICSEGYQGILCGDCDTGYSKSKQFECKACPDQTRNLIQTIFIMIGACGYVTFLVRSAMASAHEAKPVHSVYMKIMTNHFQMLGAISNIEYHWPDAIQKFQSSQQAVSSVTDQVFSFDCFLMGSDMKDNGMIPVFFQKLMMFGTLPIIVVIILILFWFVVSKIEKLSLSHYVGKFMSSLIVVLFLVHPNIAKSMFLAFNCIEVDGVYRMKENIKNVCYQGEHLKYISILVFPAIGIWVIGIPLLAFFVLLKNKDTILLMNKKEIMQAEADQILNFKMRYGFLLSGYDAKTYAWETVIMFRKILLIGASVFLSTVSTEAQVLLVILVIVLNMFLQIHFKPYFSPTLNSMENYSLQVAAMTIYIGMFYVTGKHYNYMKIDWLSWFFLVILVLPNLIFLLYWAHHMRIEVLKMAHKRNIQSIIFKIIACKDPEKFYKQYIQKEEEMLKEQEQIIIDAVKEEVEEIKIPIIEGKDEADNKNIENIDELQVSPTAVYLEEKNSLTKTNEDNSIASLVTSFNRNFDQRKQRAYQRRLAYLESQETLGNVTNRSKVHPTPEEIVSQSRSPHSRQPSFQQLIDSARLNQELIFDDLTMTGRASSKKKKKKKKKRKVKVLLYSPRRQDQNEEVVLEDDDGVEIGQIQLTSDNEEKSVSTHRLGQTLPNRKYQAGSAKKKQKTLSIQINDNEEDKAQFNSTFNDVYKR